jgi:hypothetical protein
MKLAKSTLLMWLLVSAMAGFLLLTATGCKPDLKKQRLTWNLKTLVDAYQKAGHTNPKWDEPAKRALTEFARSRSQCTESNEAWGLIISSNCIVAVNAGCDDPMIHYLYIRFSMNQTNSAQAFTDAFCKTAHDMDNSSYPAIRKFYAAARALDQIFYTYGTNTANQPVWGEMTPLIARNVEAALNDKTMSAREAYEIANQALYLISGDTNQYQQAYHCVEKTMLENWPDDYTTWLLKGTAYIQMAWNARGGGYADKVSKQGWELFFERLAVAENALTNAWRIDPTDAQIPTTMIRVDEARQKSRDDMERWFNRAMALDPNNYQACSYKLHYLYPQWYGSRDDMIAFGKECVASKTWGGTVPLILSDAHREYWLYLPDSEEKTNYWKQPDVWPDIQASFSRFFDLSPHATGWYPNYAWYAYRCEQWDKLNELIPKLELVNYDYFGGKAEFDKMVQLAKEHAGGPKVEENK